MAMNTGITITYRGQEHEVKLDNLGTFLVDIGDQALRAASIAELRASIGSLPRKKVAVPFTTADRDGHVKRGTATGVHADGRKLLIRWDVSGVTGQVTAYELRPLMTSLDAVDAEILQDLYAAQARAKAAIDGFTKAHAMDLRAAIDAELATP
jgi:hypothetical protein